MRPTSPLTQEHLAARYERQRAYQRAYTQRPEIKERRRVLHAEMRAAWITLRETVS